VHVGPVELLGLKKMLGLRRGLEQILLRKETKERRGRKQCLYLIIQFLKKIKRRDLVARPAESNEYNSLELPRLGKPACNS
jgi:hypothetical protein